jgi:hypothetical protein
VDDRFLALHGLLVRKAGDAAAVAAVTGQPADAVADVLAEAEQAGEVMTGRGRSMLTPAGRAVLEEGYPVQCADLRSDETFVAGYERFEPINRKLLDLFTRWQAIDAGGESLPNDHTDADYDAAIVDELGDLHERAERVLEAFEATLPRFAVYRRRLDGAYDRVLAGDHDYVSGVRIDSYHTVWFEMHEDLLRMLGRSREA